MPLEPEAAYLELGTIRFDDTDLAGVLLRVAELAKRTVRGASEVSVTLMRGQVATTAASTGDDALNLDETQYASGHGPCVDVAQGSGVIWIADMSREPRWPAFTRRARELGVRSSLSVALPVQEAIVGALNLYSREHDGFGSDNTQLAETFAGYAAVAIANAHLYETNAVLAENMRVAMETRAVIEQAKGILMARHACDPTAAFRMLTDLSQRSNRKLRDIAAEVVDSVGASGGA